MLRKKPVTPVNSPKNAHKSPKDFRPLQLRLQALLDLYDIRVPQAAKVAGMSKDTLYAWLSRPGSARYRTISPEQYDRLEKRLHQGYGEIPVE